MLDTVSSRKTKVLDGLGKITEPSWSLRGLFWVAHASRVLVAASRRNGLSFALF